MPRIQLPTSRALPQIQYRAPHDFTQEILASASQNPLATAIETAGQLVGKSLERRAGLRKQAKQLAELSALSGTNNLPANSSLTPEMYESGMKLRSEADSKRAMAAKQRTDLEFELEKLRRGYSEVDTQGNKRSYPGVQGLSVHYDQAGNPFAARDEGYKPAEQPKPGAGGSRGSIQQSSYVDIDGTPLLFDRDNKNYIRSLDGGAPKGTPVPQKGQAEAVQASARGKELLPKIDTLFDALDNKGELTARTSMIPGVSKVFYPEINQLKSEVKQIGFAFGGKNFTGNEEKIISDALIPNAFDNKESRDAKRSALKGYISGQIDLLGAANLLGPSGSQIKQVISKKSLQPITPRAPMPITPKKVGRFIVEQQ